VCSPKSDFDSDYFEFSGPTTLRDNTVGNAQEPGGEKLDTDKDKSDKKVGKDNKDKKEKKDKKKKKGKKKRKDTKKEHHDKKDKQHKKDKKDKKSKSHDGEKRNHKEAHTKKARNEAEPETAELEDAPDGHIAYDAVKELPAHQNPYAYFIFRRSDETIRLQATEKQAGSLAHAAKIC
ncbi:unnamed protein product, partial [Polarella glacialis]